MITGKTLRDKLSFIRDMDWGGNTNFQAMDMEFDEASQNPWGIDYQAICRKFSDASYREVVPQIVFWNLRDSRSTPVMPTQPGVTRVNLAVNGERMGHK
ncbi:hypothetical protein PR202_gb03107 [Eleusine coracana subsp. coracana]|uniref:DUF7788 domain-containing protein n=1 Tax=Eleusine coracana subsp. coracana TaxID=191504 RepID=A0AAV5DZJ6_ELECO|nr:hypothetical protein PR202_gb03107 [Eleusine coracana subsp. coracana]